MCECVLNFKRGIKRLSPPLPLQVPDFHNAKIGGLPAVNVIRDNQ